MQCLACHGFSHSSVCSACRLRFRPAADRWLPCGLWVQAGADHAGPARMLVHRLKYQGVVAAADRLVDPLLPLLDGAVALVPVPRVLARRWRLGIDPARVIADTLSQRAGLPVVTALAADWWSPRRAGRARADRATPRFSAVGRPPPGSVLVDDVVTTGSTLTAACAALNGVIGRAVCATSSNRPLKSMPGQTDQKQ